MKICSSPALSSMRSSLKPLPPGLLRLLNRLRVLCSGSSQGTGGALLYRQPLTRGWAGAPSRKLTSPSMPIRGVGAVAQWVPAELLARRDQHLHADTRDGDAAPVVAGPAAGHPQPAAGVGVGLALAVPVELDLDAALFVAVDFFAGRAGDHGGLLAQHPGLGMAQGWAVRG